MFSHSAATQKVDIVCVQDAYLFNNRPKGLPSGVAIYSSASKNCRILIFNPSVIHNQIFKANNSIFINISSSNNNFVITIGCQYSPPSANLEEDLQAIDKACNLFNKNLLLVGDLNAHSPLWGYSSQDPKGTSLINFTIKHFLDILNDPGSQPTFELPHIHG